MYSLPILPQKLPRTNIILKLYQQKEKKNLVTNKFTWHLDNITFIQTGLHQPCYRLLWLREIIYITKRFLINTTLNQYGQNARYKSWNGQCKQALNRWQWKIAYKKLMAPFEIFRKMSPKTWAEPKLVLCLLNLG